MINDLMKATFIPKIRQNREHEKSIKNGGFYPNHWVASGRDIYIYPCHLPTHEYMIFALAKLPFFESGKSLSLPYHSGSQ